MKNISRSLIFLLAVVTFFTIGTAQTPTVYRLLMGYSQNVSNNVSDILHRTQYIIDYTNALYTNSGIGHIQVELVGVWNSGYTESGSMWTDLDRLVSTDDNHMDEIHVLRDTYRADICGLFTWSQNFGDGLARDIDPSVAEAFFIARGPNHPNLVGWADWVVAHEIAHLMGARHERCNDGSTTPYSFAHGYAEPSNPREWGTIMVQGGWGCHPNAANFQFIDYLSSPELNHPTSGVPLGTLEHENNVRLTRDRVTGALCQTLRNPCGIADYRPIELVNVLGVQIIGNQEMRRAIARNSITIQDGFTVLQGGSFSAAIRPGTLSKQRVVFDKEDVPSIVKVEGALKPAAKANFINNALVMNYTVAHADVIAFDIYNVAGQHIITLAEKKAKIGNNTSKFRLPSLASGKYYVILRKNNRVITYTTLQLVK